MTGLINKTLWHQYHAFAEQRGWLIAEWLAQKMTLPGAHIADLGCGDGGASLHLARRGARLLALDLHPERLERLAQRAKDEQLFITVHLADINNWCSTEPFDAIILWDVLEHLTDPLALLRTCQACLKPAGFICIATPNKWSFIHLLCDPHYSLPLLAGCRRRTITRILISWLHWLPADKKDIAELFSWRELSRMMANAQLSIRWAVRDVAALAIQQPESVWNRPWHLWSVRKLVAWGVAHRMLKLMPVEPGRLSRWLVPTFYLVASRR